MRDAELLLPHRSTHIIRLHPYSSTCKQNPGVLITELTYWQLLMTIRKHKQQGHVPGAGGMCYREFKVMWKEILENLHKQPFVMQTSYLKKAGWWIGLALLIYFCLGVFVSSFRCQFCLRHFHKSKDKNETALCATLHIFTKGASKGYSMPLENVLVPQ